MKMGRVSTVMVFLVGSLGCASAVDEPYFSCHVDKDCPRGERCVSLEYSDKICRPPDCTDDTDCDSGEYCDDDTKQCREYCEEDWDCNMTEECNELTRRCIEESDSDV